MEAASTSLSTQLDATCQPFEARWQKLVSTTNWEKGRIISQWRAAMLEARAAAVEYSDDAWCRRVGGVTGQHVGRLRRVWDRFGATYDSYRGLFWSHFQAALDWNDAELWLEGAVQNDWSISEMRHQRWEAAGAPAELKPRPEDVIAAELDEDFLGEPEAAQRLADVGEVRTLDDGADQDQAPWEDESTETTDDEAAADAGPAAVRPFENLPELPDDLADAFEAFKLAILRHKHSDWNEIDRGAIIQTLDALKALTLAPSGEE